MTGHSLSKTRSRMMGSKSRPLRIPLSDARWNPSAPAGQRGDEWNSSQRGEEPLRRADRNFADLLQEVRVVLTGVQLLFGFLLTLAVSDRFRSIDPAMKALYVGVLVTAALTIGCSSPRCATTGGSSSAAANRNSSGSVTGWSLPA